MSTYGLASVANTTSYFVQSAEPDDLAAKIQAIFPLAASLNKSVTNITLAGGGDGHTFSALVLTASSPSNSLAPDTNILCYLASSADALAVARAAAIAARGTSFPAANTIIDEQLAGASKGTRFMGLIVADP